MVAEREHIVEEILRESGGDGVNVPHTATPRVQDDIAAQLGLVRAHRFIHGFRRTNIGIEVAPLKMGAERAAAVRAVLSDPARRPAIVYAPTRKEADALATELLGAGQRARITRA